MANYDEWNKAIAEYFVSGLASGAIVYLSVDEDTLMDIGMRFKQSETDNINWVEDFKEAVISECVKGSRIHFPWIFDQADQIPCCVAFLAAMVLAAHHMIKEDIKAIAENDYFKRLREVLGLPIEDGGRPKGLDQAGTEENLWLVWNRWLIDNGCLPSAERGQHARKFINYPLSQTLLRDSDKRTIELRFREKERTSELGRVYDRDTIGFWVRNQHFGSKHLRDLIQESDFSRYEAITDAVFEVYTSIDWDQDMETTPGKHPIRQRRMAAELYREENAIMGEIKYYLYPRQPRQFDGETLEIVHNGIVHRLRKERQGWFMPLFPVNPAGGISYEVKGHPQIKELYLPERKFWILVRDPETDTSGDFAGWKRPGLGENFILLCKKEYENQMEFFKQEALFEWYEVVPVDNEWVEYRECMIRSQSWEGIIPQYQDLHDALKPSISATISLKGGLRVQTNQGGWLEGFQPELTIFSFDDSISLKLHDTSVPDDPIMDQVVNTNKPISSIPSLGPGVYLFEVYSSEKLAARRSLQILPWDSLECPHPEQHFDVNAGTFIQRGAVIKINEANDTSEV